jgi:hypothetical protein
MALGKALTDEQKVAIERHTTVDGWPQSRIAYALELSQPTVSAYLYATGLKRRPTPRRPRPIVHPTPDAAMWPSKCWACGSTVDLEPDWLGALYPICLCRKVA